jgi:hypothetical protein
MAGAATDHRQTTAPRRRSPSFRTWTTTDTGTGTGTGFSISGHLPPWSTDDPSAHHLPTDQLGLALSDIDHHQAVCGRTLPLCAPEAQKQYDRAVAHADPDAALIRRAPRRRSRGARTDVRSCRFRMSAGSAPTSSGPVLKTAPAPLDTPRPRHALAPQRRLPRSPLLQRCLTEDETRPRTRSRRSAHDPRPRASSGSYRHLGSRQLRTAEISRRT